MLKCPSSFGLWLLLGFIFIYVNASAGTILRVASDASDAAPDGKTWDKAYPTLDKALEAAVADTEIWIKTGTYKPAGSDRNAAFVLKNRLIIRGGFKGDETAALPRNPWAYPTVLSGDIGARMLGEVTALNDSPRQATVPLDPGWDDNCYNVLVGEGLDDVTLEYVTITGASATDSKIKGADIDAYEMYSADPSRPGVSSAAKPSSKVVGGGIFFTTGTGWKPENRNLKLLGCTFVRNRARGYGGAVGVYDTCVYADTCTFKENVSGGTGGAFWGFNQQAGFVGCTFANNSSHKGGGAVSLRSLPSVRAEDPVDEYGKYIRMIASMNSGADLPENETREQARQRIFYQLMDYSIYRSDQLIDTSPEGFVSNNSISYIGNGVTEAAGEGGFFDTMATELRSVQKTTMQTGQTLREKIPFSDDEFATAYKAVKTANTIRKAVKLLSNRPTNAWEAMKATIAVTDVVVDVLDLLGYIDTNSPGYKAWKYVAGGFQDYASGAFLFNWGVQNKIKDEDLLTPQMRVVRINALKNSYTLAGRSAFASCNFIENETDGSGGAIELAFSNMVAESCTFTRNRAVSDAGAISSAVYSMPQVISSVFNGNYSDIGSSAITNTHTSLMIVANCTIINNKSFDAEGAALMATMGGDMRVYNSILWNNANGKGQKGADVLVTTRETMDSDGQKTYDALQHGEQANWVGLMDIRNSIVQSLATIPLGEDHLGIVLIGTNLEEEGIRNAAAVRDAADAIGELESTGEVNAGWGVREKLRDPAFGNTDQNPLLLATPVGKPSRLSPANDGGWNQWCKGRIISNLTLLNEERDVAFARRIQGARIDIGAYERNPSAPLDDNVPLAGDEPFAFVIAEGPQPSGVGAGAPPVIGNKTPLGVTVYRVKPGAHGSGSSWSDAADLQTALNQRNAEVWVAAGIYKPTSGTDRTAPFSMAPGVRIFGGFEGIESEVTRAARNWRTNATVISGDIGRAGDPTDNSKNLFRNVDIASSALIDGFTFQDAYSLEADGGAILNTNSSPVILNCVFRNNLALNGGAIHSSGANEGGSILVNCEFLDNTAVVAGGAIFYSHALFGNNLVFRGNNAAIGGAISVAGSSDKDYCTIQNGLFYGNSSSAGTGGAISSRGLYLNVQNSTFYGNASTINDARKAGGGAIDHSFPREKDTSSAVIINSIFYKNTAVNTANGSVETMEKRQILTQDSLFLRNSLVQGLNTYAGHESDDNFDGDPQFIEEGSDFRLQQWSLGIDAGNSSDYYTDFLTTDLNGNKRLVNRAVDLGPYETPELTPQRPLTRVTMSSAGSEIFTFTTDYVKAIGDTLRWYVDRGDGLGYVLLAENEDDENTGVSTETLTVKSPPNGFSYRLQVIHNGGSYISPLVKLLPTAESIGRYVYVKPVATGDGNGTSWADATGDLQTAISKKGAEVWVAQGVYRPGTDRDAHFAMASGVKIYGGFFGNETKRNKRDWRAKKTIISGEIGTSAVTDNIRSLFINTNTGNSSIMDGLYLQGAYGDGVDGGAIRNISSFQTIQNCVFEANHARNGGAIFSMAGNSYDIGSKLFNCEFRGNSAELAGGAVCYNSSMSSSNLLFMNNTAGTGGAVYATGKAEGEYCTLQNSLFAGNIATDGPGGGVRTNGLYLSVLSSTLYGNHATVDSTGLSSGGAVHVEYPEVDGSALLVHNSIFYKNTALNTGSGGRNTTEKQQIFKTAGGGHLIRNSLVDGLDTYKIGAADTNFEGDPLFVDEGTDFHVTNGSLTIDSGEIKGIRNLETLDLDGNDRVINGFIDLGPYEHAATAASPLKKVIAVSKGLEDYNYTVQYTAQQGDTLQWYVDRGDDRGFLPLGASDPGHEHLPVEYLGTDTTSLTIHSPPSGFLFRLQLVRAGTTFYSPVARLNPTEISKGSYVYVRPTATGDGSGSGWTNATSDLQTAMSHPNAQVWVQQGTYFPTSGTDRNVSFSLTAAGVKVYGGFQGTESLRDARNPTLYTSRISGAIGGPGPEDNSKHLFKNENVRSSVVLDGLTFEDAYAGDEDGGAILNISASPTIQNCVFRSNYARNGGAIHSTGTPVSGFGSDLLNCQFINNKAELKGGAISCNGSMTAVDVIFKGNRAGEGGAVNLEGSSGGLVFSVKNGVFSDNRALSGNGGAIFSKGLALSVTNSTFYGNRATLSSSSKLGGGGIYQDYQMNGIATVAVYNSIFYENNSINPGTGGLASREVQQIAVRNDGGINADHSLIQGLDTYANTEIFANFDENPEFVDAVGGNFRLLNVSPAINAGVHSAGGSSLLSDTDLDGNARVQLNTIDLGAYEFAGTAAIGKMTSSSEFSADVMRFFKNSNYTAQPGDILQWYVDRGDGNYVLLAADSIYSGVNSASLAITGPPSSADGYKFRLQVENGGNTLISLPTVLKLPLARIYVNAARLGMSADGAGWNTAYGDLAAALKASGPGSSIWVARGTYHPTSGANTEAAFRLPAMVEIYGGFISGASSIESRNPDLYPTILSGMINGATNRNRYSRHVVLNQGALDRTAVLDGFILQDSYSSLMRNDGASPTIRNCVFQGNDSNWAADGAGAAIAVVNGANPLIAECRFLRNKGVYAGALHISEAGATVENSVFAGNNATAYGGAIVVEKGTLNMVHCTMADNTTQGVVAGLYAIDSTVTVSNSVFWNNRIGYSGFTEYDQTIKASGGSITFRSSCVEGGTSLPATNVTSNPLFDPSQAQGGYALAIYSPLVNAGSAVETVSSSGDLLGRPRVFENLPDMGAYEVQANAPVVKVKLTSLPRSRVSYNIGGSVDFVVTWPSGSTLDPRWTVVDSSNMALAPSRYTIILSGNTSTVRINNISLADTGIKVSFTDVAQGLLYTPPATLTVRVPRIVRVDATASGLNDGSSWTNAYTDLATALDQSQTADEIWVAGGTYKAGTSSSFRLKSTVSLYGGFSGSETTREARNIGEHPTILHPEDGSPILYGAARESEYGLPSVLDGFTVENSTGPVSVYNYLSDTIYRNCVFRKHSGYLGNFQSEVTYDNCEFSGHTGTLFYIVSSPVTFKDCEIHDNTTTGDLIISNNLSAVTLSDTVVSGNTIAGALFRNGGSSLGIFRSAFRSNSTGGAVIDNGSTGTGRIESSLFAGNLGSRDFATIQSSGTLSILASTFADNYGGSYGGGLATYPESVTSINSCIFWGNRGSRTTSTLETQQLGNGSGTWTVKRSIIEGLATHTATALNNTSYYPVFANPSAGDYHLLASSPAIDTGEPNLVLTSALDLDKAPRPHPVIYMDAGAYEFQGTASQPLKVSAYPSSVATAETSGTSFVVKGSAFYGYRWQYWNGTEWINVTNTGYFRVVNSANSDTSTLNIDTPPLSLNGTRFRVTITGSGGVTHTTGDLVLTVNEPRVIYVNGNTSLPKASTDGSTWAKAYQTVQEALAVTTEDCEIWVQEGTYAFSSTANLKWNVHLYGGFAGDETERDQRDWEANPVTLLAYGKRIFSTSDPVNHKVGNAVLDGFTLSGSTSETALFLSASDAVIRNCVFRGNTRAIGVSGRSNPVIGNCVFDSHRSTVMSLEGDSATITGSTFLNNQDSSGSASGAIVYVARGNVKISDSTFTGNTSNGGVIVAYGNYDATSAANLTAGKVTQLNMSRCTMTGNTAYAGILTNQSLLILDNSLIARNTLYTTAVRGFSRSQFNLTNVVIAHNIGELESVAINCDANVYLSNSIIWGNRTSWPYGPIIRPGSPSLVEDSQIKRNSWTFISNSLVEGAYAISGNGNSGYDPLFVDAAAMDYRVPAMSPAVNGGTAAGIPTGTLDLLSQPRVHDTAPDIGAYEFTGVAQTPIRMNSNLDNRTVIVGLDAQYTVQTAAGINVRWQVKSGGVFVDFVPGVNQTLSEDGKVMTLSHLTIPMSGTEFRFVLSGSVSYTSAPGVLTVVPKPLVFVNASATGDNNGTSWENAFTSMNDAIDGASDLFTGGPREIRVAQGTYTTNTSLAPGVELVGGFAGGETERTQRDVLAHPTILTLTVAISSAGGSDILSNSNPDPKKIGIVVDGFTLTGTTSGITVRNAPALIRNCTFSNLVGVGLTNVSGPMTVEDCTFDQIGNFAINAGPSSTTIIRRSIFQGGKSMGVVSGTDSTVSIEDSIFRDNTPIRADDPTLYVVPNSTVSVTRSQFLRNHGTNAIFNDGRLLLRQSLVADNYGGGVGVNYRAQITRLNAVTIAQNAQWGISIGWQNGSLSLANCIIAGNKFHQQIYTNSGGVFGSNTLIQGEAYEFPGSQNWDPLFTNAAAGDYTLSPRSPAINAANAAYVESGETDLAGNVRIQSDAPDMGAYESSAAPDPLYRSKMPESLTITRGVDAVFSLTGHTSYNYTWEYFNGSEWVTITDSMAGPGGFVFRINKTGGKTTLTIPNPPSSANGIKVRVTIDGQGVTSEPATVTVVEPEIIYIDGSVAASGDGKTWATAFKTLAEVTDANNLLIRISQSRRILYLSAGTYTNPSGFYFQQRVEVYGGFPAGGSSFADRDASANRVILSGEVGDPASTEDNTSTVVMISATNHPIGLDSIFDGLSVEGGKSGIRVSNNATPTFRNMIVSHNAGTGILFDYAGGRVENSQFIANTSSIHGGGAATNYSAVTFTDCVFSGNTAKLSGGGLYLQDGPARLENCVISGNQSIGEGGGVEVSSGSHLLINCTVVGNFSTGSPSPGGGGGLYVYQGGLAVWNTIVWANRTDQSTRNPSSRDSIETQQMNKFPYGASFNVQASNIEGLDFYTNAGANIGADPLFFENIAAENAPTTAGDFHVQGGSPVTDKGNPGLMGMLTDADGAPRSVRTVDIGAYELQGVAISLQPADLVYSPGSANQYHVELFESNERDVYQWEISTNGSDYTPLTDGAVYSGSRTGTLQLLTDNPAQHGNSFRVKITSADGSVAISRSASLVVYADHYYVNAAAADDSGDGYTWATAFKTLGTALAKARLHPTDGARIWVADGTYLTSDTDTGISYPLKSNIALYGGFAGNETALAARNFLTHQTILKGITGTTAVFASSGDIITGARIDGFAFNTGATGIKLGTNVTLTVANCSFTGLETGISLILDSVTVENCRFTGLSSQGIYGIFSTLSVSDSVFESNQQGIVNVSGSLNVARSVFRGNGSPDLYGGGIRSSIGSATVDSSLFSGNRSLNGAGLYAESGYTTVRNSTFSGNSRGLTRAYANGGLGTLQVYNSIFWGNGDGGEYSQIFYDRKGAGDEFYANNVQGVVLSYSDFISTNGNGNTSVDPLFISPVAFSGTATTAGDYRLSPSSPIINKGSNVRLGASTTDLAGNPRTFDTTVDMGAYELQFIQLFITSQPVDAAAGLGRSAVFHVATNHPTDASYQWQVKLNDTWTDVTASSDESGVTTATLTVAGNAAYDGRLYRVHVTTSDSGEVFSNAATYRYAFIAVTPPAGIRHGPLTGTTSSISFNVAGGVLPASVTDGSFTVHGMQTGRLSIADGSLSAPTVSGNTVTMQSSVPFKPGELVEVTTTPDIQRADSFHALPMVYQFRAGNRSSYGIFPVPTPIPGARATARAIASGDLNGNGSIDLVVGGSGGATVWSNGGTASFTEGRTFSSGTVSQVLLGSLGMTGSTGSKNKLDVILRKLTGEVEIWRNEGNGEFSNTSTISGVAATYLALADLNADGSLDLFIATAGADQVWFNNGAGAFSDSTQRLGNGPGLSVTVGDFNNDNSLDVATANGDFIELWKNSGVGQFSAAPQVPDGTVYRVIASDVDRDGRLDMVGVLTTGALRVFRQYADLQFRFTSLSDGVYGAIPEALNIGDVDGDGTPDLLTSTRADSTPIRLWSGRGYDSFFTKMNFQQVTEQPVFPLNKATDLADLNGDGRMDLITIDPSGTPTISLYAVTPLVPTDLAAVVDSDIQVSLAWTDTATSETNYTVERSPNGSDNWTVITLPANSTSYIDTELAPSTPYFYRVRSNVAGTLQSPYSLTVSVTTAAPVTAVSDSIAVMENSSSTNLVGGATSVLVNDVNPEGATLEAVILTSPAHGSLSLNTDGTFRYSPNAGYFGSDGFTYRATNVATHASAVGTVSITVTRLNDAPANLTLARESGTLYTGQTAGLTVATLSASDPDPEDDGLLTFSLVAGGGSTGNADFAFTGATLKTAGAIDATKGLSRSVRIRVTDSMGLFVEKIFAIAFTQAPTAIPVTFSTDEDTSVAVLLSGMGGAADLGYTIVNPPGHGTLSPGANGNAYTYTPAADFNGSDSFTYRVTDSVLTSTAAAVTINVSPVNDAPTLAAVGPVTTVEDTPVSFTLVGSDVDGDAMTSYQLVSTPTLGSVQVNGAVVTYTPFTDVLGTETLTFTVTAGGQTSLPLEVEVTITGEPVASLVYRGLFETTTIPTASGNWSNPSIAITNPPSHGTVVNTGSDFLYTHSGDSATGDHYSYTVTNSAGEVRTIAVALTIVDHVIIVNSTDDDTLNATDDSGHTTLQEALAIVDRFWDKPLTGTDGIRADWTIRIATRPRAYSIVTTRYEGGFAEGYRSASRIRGKVTIEAPPATGMDVYVIMVPNEEGGPRNFLVTQGARLSLKNLIVGGGQGTVVHGAGQPAGSNVSRGGGIYNLGTLIAENVIFDTLKANTGSAIHNNGGTVSLNHCDLRSNNSASFEGSDGGTIWSRNGSLTLNDVTLDNGDTPELFVVGDGALATVAVSESLIRSVQLIKRNSGTLAVTGLPLAIDDTIAYPVGQPLTFSIDSLLANDSGVPLKNVTVSSTSAKGIAITRDGNNLTYDADATLDGDSFTYTITKATDARLDASDTSSDLVSTATVTLDFQQKHGYPLGRVDTGTVYRGYTTVIPVLGNDTDPTDRPLTLTAVSTPAHGTATIEGSTIRYSHDGGDSATDSFTYSVSNGDYTTENVAVAITVNKREVIATSGDDSGPGTLRAALTFIDSFEPAQPWTIKITAANGEKLGATTSINNEFGRCFFEITGNVTIDATDSPGFTIFSDTHQMDFVRIFHVRENASLTLRNLSLQGALGNTLNRSFDGAGVLNHGTLITDNVVFQYFQATRGAAIFSDGTKARTTISRSTFIDNGIINQGWGNYGAVVIRNGIVTLSDVTFADAHVNPELYVLADGQTATVILDGPPSYPYLFETSSGGTIVTPGLPMAQDDVAQCPAGFRVSIPIATLLANDSEAADPTIKISVGAAESGQASVVVSGNAVIYDPNDDFQGDDSFTYTLETESGFTSTATVRITAMPAPRISIRVEGFDLGDSSTVDFSFAQLGENAGMSNNVDIFNYGSGGLDLVPPVIDGANPNDFEITYSGNSMVSPGTQTSVSVRFTPTGAGQRTATLHIKSNDLNRPDIKLILTGFANTVPTYEGYAVNVPYNTSVPMSLAKILSKAHDQDGDTLTFINPARSANNGTLIRTGSILQYTPPSGFIGEDRFNITVRDNHGKSVTGVITLHVAGPDGPLADNMNPPKLTVVPGGGINLDFQGVPNRAYDIERSVDLGAWEVIATRTANKLGKIEFVDSAPPSGSGFYRIKKH